MVLVSIYCVFKAIQKRNVVGLGQRSRFLVLTKRSAASGDENGSGLNLLCFQSHSKTECRWTGPEVAILSADQKERGLWERE